MEKQIRLWAEEILSGGQLGMAEGLELIQTSQKDIFFLLVWADQIRQKFRQEEVDLCSICNGRSGRCSEDCHYCAQSIYYQTGAKEYRLLSPEQFLRAAKQSEKDGSHRFSIVTSGPGGKNDEDFQDILNIYRQIHKETSLELCASVGSLTLEKARALKDAGVRRYHHNIETARSYYGEICTTHSFEERVETIHYAKAAGLEVCSGGILGLGESPKQRVEMALILRDLAVDCVPLNILTPIAGTPLESQKPLSPLDYLRAVATFRFLLPKAGIRSAGGREKGLRDLQSMLLLSGADGMMIGGYLTTGGRPVEEDRQMIKDLELKIVGGIR